MSVATTDGQTLITNIFNLTEKLKKSDKPQKRKPKKTCTGEKRKKRSPAKPVSEPSKSNQSSKSSDDDENHDLFTKEMEQEQNIVSSNNKRKIDACEEDIGAKNKRSKETQENENPEEEEEEEEETGGDDEDNGEEAEEDGEEEMENEEGEDIEISVEDKRGPKTRSKTASKKQAKVYTALEQAERFSLKRHITFSSLPVLLAPIVREEKEILFNDDDFFTLDDNVVRRIVYRQIPSKELFHNIKRITMFNFTANQFECTGATRWEHLKTHYWDLFCSVFDSLGYATGKKSRNTPPAKVAPNGNKNRRTEPSQPSDSTTATTAASGDSSVVTNRSGVSGGETDAAGGDEDQPVEKESQFLQGNSDITVVCEPLLSHGTRCAGFRIWIFDKGVPKNESDHFSLGLKESLQESAIVADMATRQAAFAIKSTMPRSTKGKKPSQKEYQILREFNYTKHPTFDRHFMNIVRRYFSTDPCFVFDQEQSKLIDDIEPENANHKKFTDNRPFVNYDAMGFNTRVNLFNTQNASTTNTATPATKDYTSKSHPCNMTQLFNKVAGMHYYVLDAGINQIQCQLSSYFKGASSLPVFNADDTNESDHISINIYDMGRDDDAAAVVQDEEIEEMNVEQSMEKSKPNKSTKATTSSLPDAGIECNIPDSAFEGFPHENIVCQIDNIFLSREFMSRMPLMCRIGSTFYTGKDERLLHELAGIDQRQHQQEDLDQWFDGENEKENERDNVLMGLHDCEYELTTETLLSQIYHLDERSAALLKYPIVPKSVLKKFMFNKMNEINTRLKLIMSCLGPKGRVVIGEKPIDSTGNVKKKVNRVELPDSHTNLLNINAHRPPPFSSTVTSLSLTDYSVALQTLQEPYISYTEPGFINNISKKAQIRRKALEYRRRHNTLDDNDKEQLKEYASREYQNKVASGNVGHFKEIIEKYRPFGNSLDVIKTKLHNVRTEDVFLSRDIFLRLAELNKEAYKNLNAAFFDPETGRVRFGMEEAYYEERGRLVDALVVECWDEFFKNPHVSMAVEGVRNDLLRQHVAYRPPSNDVSQVAANNSSLGRKTIGRPLNLHQYRHDLRPYSAFRVWIHGFLSDQGGITYNYKTASILYFSKFHHCRWFPQCNNPKLNIILSGSGMAGKSKMLQLTKDTCPSSVGDMVTHVTDQAFNIDRNLNDMLLIYEEFQNKYLGYTPNGNSGKNSGGNGGGTSGGVSSGDSKDTTNFFKARLTGGKTATFSYFENEDTNMRDMKISQAHCQGNLLAATNNDLSEADLNVLSRLILISVPKSKHAIEGLRPQDRDKMGYGQSRDQDDEMFEEHKEIHRVYVLMEQIFKSNATGDDTFGVNVDSARIQLLHILDQLQFKYGIPTNDVRKRNHVLELSRCMNLSFSVWMGLTSTLTRHLQYSPHSPELEPEEKQNKSEETEEPRWIGFNPRVITEGILPFCNVTTDQVIDAATSLSCLWYHEYQNLILEVFSTKKCRLQELRESDFLYRKKAGFHHTAPNASARTTGYAASSMQENSNSGYGDLSRSGGYGMLSASSTQATEEPKEIDYNYIKFSGKNYLEIAREISLDLGELVVAPADILKLLTDLSRSRIDDIDGYEMDLSSVDEKGRTRAKLIKSTDIKKKKHRYVVDMSYCQVTQRPTISILVHFLKHELPHIFTDDIIENLEEKKDKEQEEEEEQVDIEAIEKEIMQEEEEEETAEPEDIEEDRYYKSIRDIGRIGKRTESLITKAIKDIVQHPAYDFTGLSKEKEEELRDSYRNPMTGSVPWDNFITADPPKPVKLTEFYPELKAKIGKTKTGDKDILFPDRLLMLELRRRKKAPKLIIQNHNVVASSTRNSLSIYDNIVDKSSANRSRQGERRELTRNRRVEEYMDTDAWELDQDLDFITANEHLRNIGFRGLKTAKNYTTINYPPSTYMALIDHKRRIDAAELGKPLDDEEVQKPLLEYPFYDNIKRVESRKRKIEGELNPAKVKYPKFSPFIASNFAETSEIYKRSNAGDSILLGKPVNRSIEKERAFLKKQYESALFKSL